MLSPRPQSCLSVSPAHITTHLNVKTNSHDAHRSHKGNPDFEPFPCLQCVNTYEQFRGCVGAKLQVQTFPVWVHTHTHTLCLPAEQQWSHHNINLRSASLRESQLSEVAALIQKQPHEIVKVIKIEGRRIFLGHFVLFQFRSWILC